MISSYQKFQQVKFSGPEEILRVQTLMLREHLAYLRSSSPAYKKILKDLNPESFEFKRLAELPLTRKEDIEKDPPSFLAVPPERMADIVLSSGTTGKPLQIFYTAADLERLAYNENEAFAGCGIEADDRVLLTCTMDRCFVAGLAYFLGLRARGATVIRNGHGVIESHAELIRTLRPTVLVGVPSFLKKLGQALSGWGQNPAQAGVRKLICIGEPLRQRDFALTGTAQELERLWQARIFSTYASSETITTFCECTAQRGGHLIPELAAVEIVDEEGRLLPNGQAGEVVLTPFAVEGMPLLRYQTGDISFLEDGPCSCGRYSSRLGPVLGRKKQRMKVRGTSLYPQAVFTAVEDIPEVLNYYVEAFSDSELSDRLVVHLSLNTAEMTREKLGEILGARLRVTPEIIVENDAVIKKSIFTARSRKPIHFFDRRNNDA